MKLKKQKGLPDSLKIIFAGKKITLDKKKEEK